MIVVLLMRMTAVVTAAASGLLHISEPPQAGFLSTMLEHFCGPVPQILKEEPK